MIKTAQYDVYTTTKVDELLTNKMDSNENVSLLISLVSGTDFNVGTDIDLLTAAIGNVIIGIVSYNNVNYSVSFLISSGTNRVLTDGTVTVEQGISESDIPYIVVKDNDITVTPTGFSGVLIKNIE